MVEYLTHNPKIYSSNPAAGTGTIITLLNLNGRVSRIMFFNDITQLDIKGITVVEHLTHKTMNEGSNPGAGIGTIITLGHLDGTVSRSFQNHSL